MSSKTLNAFKYCTIPNIPAGSYFGRGGEFWESGTWKCPMGVATCHYDFSFFTVEIDSCETGFQLNNKVCEKVADSSSSTSNATKTLTCPLTNQMLLRDASGLLCLSCSTGCERCYYDSVLGEVCRNCSNNFLLDPTNKIRCSPIPEKIND